MKHLSRRWRPAFLAFATVGALGSGLVAAMPGSAQASEETKEYTASFEAECILAPGVLNTAGKLKITTRAIGPATAHPGQEVTFTGASSTVTTPASWGSSLAALGSVEARGFVKHFELVSTNLSPAELNIATPSEFPEGLPYSTPVKSGEPITFTVPRGNTFSFGPYTVTGSAGQTASLSVGTEAGFVKTSSGYEATGKGIVSTTEGYNASGEKTIGPVQVVCTAPSGVVLGSTPITSTTTTTTTTSSTPTTTTSTTSTSTTTTSSTSTTPTTTTTSTTTTPTTTTTSTTTTPTTTTSTTTSTTTTTPSGIPVKFENWKLSGSLTDHKLNQTINLPEGCTFNGQATVPGSLEANTACPPFKATVKLFGFIPINLGLELVESGPVTGTITGSSTPGYVLIKATAKDNIKLTAVGLLGLNIPVSCETAEPVVFPLEATGPALEVIANGTTAKGETTLPSIRCGGGFLGGLFGAVITELMSGPHNPFTFKIAP